MKKIIIIIAEIKKYKIMPQLSDNCYTDTHLR